MKDSTKVEKIEEKLSEDISTTEDKIKLQKKTCNLLLTEDNSKVAIFEKSLENKKSQTISLEEPNQITEREKDEFLKFTECNICLFQAINPLSCPQCQFLACESCLRNYFKKYTGSDSKCPCCKKHIVLNDLIKLKSVIEIQNIIYNKKNKTEFFNEIENLFKQNMSSIDDSLIKYEKNIKYLLEIQKTVKNYKHDLLDFISSFKRELDNKCDFIIKENVRKIDLSVTNQVNLSNLKSKHLGLLNLNKSHTIKEKRNQNELIKDSIENIFLLGKKLAKTSPLSYNNTNSNNNSKIHLAATNKKSNSSNSIINFNEKQKFVEPSFETFNSKKVKIPLINDKQNRTRVDLGILKEGTVEFVDNSINIEEARGDPLVLEELNDYKEGGDIICKLSLDTPANCKKKYFVSMCLCSDTIEKKFHLIMDNSRMIFSKTISQDELFGSNDYLKNNSMIYFEIFSFNVL